MKSVKTFLCIIVFTCPIFSQSAFNLDAYKLFLKSHENLGAQALLNMHPAGAFYGDINSSYTDAEYFDSIDALYQLTTYEKSLINKNGFMVSERLKSMTFGQAFMQIYNQDLPIYISTDAILHALHRSYDKILKEAEVAFLINNINTILTQMHQNMPVLEQKYSNIPDMLQILRDVDVYLTVALKPLDNSIVPFYQSNNSLVDYYVQKMYSAQGMEDEKIFAENCRKFDWSQFKPRGHYTDEYIPMLAEYFRTMMWLGRTELYLIEPENVYPICVPDFYDVRRQTIMTLLINELFVLSGVHNKFEETEGILGYFVGEPDNVTMPDIDYLKNAAGVTDADDLLDSLKLIQFQDTLKNQSFAHQKILSQVLYSAPMSPDSIVPAAAFLLFGQRFIIDSYVMGSVVYDRITYDGDKICRLFPSALDPMFALGNDAAGQLLLPELNEYKYAANLAGLRYLIDTYDKDFWESTIYNQWLNCIRKLNPPKDRGGLPDYMKTAAFWQKQLNTQLASWTELRHDNLLYAKQSYTGGTTCEFPYTYIEPFPEFFEALKTLGSLGRQKFAEFTLPGKEEIVNYFSEVESICDTLRIISEKELSGTPYTREETDFLHKVIYPFLSGSGDPPYKGWYPRLLFKYYNEEDILLVVDYLVADVHTVPTDCGGIPLGAVVHVGTGPMNMGVFIADVPGYKKTAFIGPVYSYHNYSTLNYQRLTDEDWKSEYLYKSTRPDWVNTYLADSNGDSKGPGAALITGTDIPQAADEINYLVVENYPNPFNPETNISFNIPKSMSFQEVKIEIFNIQGEQIKTLYSGQLPAGNYFVQWNATNNLNRNVSSGVYICRVNVGETYKTRKMTLLK